MLEYETKQKTNKILPILIEKIQVPKYIQNRVFADFSKDYNSGLEHLLKKLKAQSIIYKKTDNIVFINKLINEMLLSSQFKYSGFGVFGRLEDDNNLIK